MKVARSGLPPVVCIVGRKDSGKTSLTVALAAELNRRGRRVMTVKHGHGFRLDEAGKDSWRHRHEGGAVRTVVAGPRDFGVVGRWPRGGEMTLSELVERFLWDADIVLAEGFKGGVQPTIEVRRGDGEAGPPSDPSDPSPGRAFAVVTDGPELQGSIPSFFLGDWDCLPRLADLVERRLLTKAEP